jgi:hypothetical protein
MATSTYSFSDTKITLSFPGQPIYVINGQGVGELTVSFVNDNTAHDLAADGSVMVSKIKADNATVALSIQQTSPLDKWLTNTFNYLNNALTPQWAAGTINISSSAGIFDDLNLAGVSFTKRADKPFQQQGQMVTWNFMAATVQILGTGSFQSASTVVGRIVT